MAFIFFIKVSRYATNILLDSDIIHMSLSPQVLITCAPEKETLIMTPAEKEKIITENRPFIRQHVKQKFPKFMKTAERRMVCQYLPEQV